MQNKRHHPLEQLKDIFAESVKQYPNHPALICGNIELSYQALDQKTNQFAHHLRDLGLKEGDVIGILLDRSLESYLAILSVLKLGAAYVPIETEYPDERINYILSDLSYAALITSESQAGRVQIKLPLIVTIEQSQAAIDQSSTQALPPVNIADPSALAYVIYTSGTTGKPKGVEIGQQSICHYVRTASAIYQMQEQDRVYQGFSLAFDASLEELWMAWANGAALIACLDKETRSGLGLIEFLNHNQVTVFSTVPTLLGSLEGDLPWLRLLILGGEACSASLIKRWHRPDLRIINSYGPTEATVIASYCDCYPDKPITIGQALPGYEILILNEDLEPLKPGEAGELAIGGLGLARGYVNQPENTAIKFIPHPEKPGQRLYRSGDLAKINEQGQIEFLGRVDDQIKLRGFRIELNEIEQVIMDYGQFHQAVVALQELDSPTLVAYLHCLEDRDFDLTAFKRYLQDKLPYYMIPGLFEEVPGFACLPSGKVNRKALPQPKSRLEETEYSAPQTAMEETLSAIWRQEFKLKQVSTQADFFHDLGGHSLLAAKIISQLRSQPGLETLSIRDLYAHPNIQQLAQYCQQLQRKAKALTSRNKYKPSTIGYYACALGQLFGCLLQYALSVWQFLALIFIYHWLAIEKASSKEIFFSFCLIFTLMPIASLSLIVSLKWLLLGRVKPGKYKLWGWFYCRWWLIQRLQQNLFNSKHLIATPLLNLYYRLMGAKIGKNCFIGTASVSVHDGISIGDNSSIGYDARLLNYLVEDGWLKIGRIEIGNDCFVGARAVVSYQTVMEDGSVLDEMSMLPPGSIIPAKQYYSGSPATQGLMPPQHLVKVTRHRDESSVHRNLLYGTLHYLGLLFNMVLHYGCFFPALSLINYLAKHLSLPLTFLIGMPLGAIVYLGTLYCAIILTKRLLLPSVKTGIHSVKSLYYLRQWLVMKLLDDDAVYVMADSLYMPVLMRLLGAKLGKDVEMGEAPHLLPDLLSIDEEGFAASSVAFAWPMVYQGTIRFSPVRVEKRAFLGNVSFLPGGKTLGEEGLIGVLSTTPADNSAAENNTSWLGSPAVFLPKRELALEFTEADRYLPTRRQYWGRLAIEFIRIIAPTTLTLAGFFSLLLAMGYLVHHVSHLATFLLLPIAEAGIVLGLVGLIVAFKWLILGRLKPARKSVWDLFIRRLDLIEYLYSYFINIYYTNITLGTPFAAPMLRAMGAKIGRRVFLETAQFAEFDLISIADDACINAETLIDTHLYEDRIFKMSTIDIRAGANVGIGSVILYDTIMHENSTLGSLSLLMKGESLPQNSQWEGTPAQTMQGDPESVLTQLEGQAVKEEVLVA